MPASPTERTAARSPTTVPIGEFEIIERYFRPARTGRDDVRVGIGDDAAVLAPPPGAAVATALACLGAEAPLAFAGDASLLGHQLAATALNRLAARGAEPAWLTLALSLPSADEAWLERFAGALRAVAKPLGVELVGGDTTRGPLAATVLAHGTLSAAGAPARPRPGHGIYVSGPLAQAALAARRQAGRVELAASRWRTLRRSVLERSPRVALARRAIACGGAAADASAGLRAALRGMLVTGTASAEIALARLPLAPLAARGLPRLDAWRAIVEEGGDPELCLALADDDAAACAAGEVELTRVGEVARAGGVRFLLEDASELHAP